MRKEWKEQVMRGEQIHLHWDTHLGYLFQGWKCMKMEGPHWQAKHFCEFQVWMRLIHVHTHRQTGCRANSLLHVPMLLHMRLTPGLKQLSVKRWNLFETALKHLSPECIMCLHLQVCSLQYIIKYTHTNHMYPCEHLHTSANVLHYDNRSWTVLTQIDFYYCFLLITNLLHAALS